MSSTNRGFSRQEHVSDYYITPVDKIVDFLNAFDLDMRDLMILDPCCGGDKNTEMSYPKALAQKYPDIKVDTIDIREDSRASLVANYLEVDCKDKYDIIITNPPFNISKDIILKALDDVKDGGYVVMLLRLNYFGGKVRSDLWNSHMPEYCFVHNKRISFTSDGKTDSIEYCHMVWKKGYNNDYTKLKVLVG